MQFSALLISLLFPLLVRGSFLDIEELNNIHYAITIGDEPIAEDAGTTPEHVTMVNKMGQKYRCHLPKLKEADSEDSQDEGEGIPDVATLLEPLTDLPCLFKTKDWWTYEFCYGRHIKQYHLENDKPVGVVMMLGVASLLEEEVNQQLRYYPRWFTNGSRCDLTGRPRKTEVRFVCDETAQREIIGEILEPQSCEYTMVISTNRICSVPWLRPPADAAPLPINCNPLLSRIQLDNFMLYQEAKQRQALAMKARKEEDQKASLIKQLSGEDITHIDVDSKQGLDVLQNMVGEKVANKLVGELNLLLDSALKQQGGGGQIKVLDLTGNNEVGKDKTLNSILKSKKSKEDSEEEDKEKEGKWDVVHGGHKNYFRSDPTVQKHLRERNTLWRKIHETKKRITKLKGQIQDHTLMIKNHADSSKEALASYEAKKVELEEQLVIAKESLALLEDAARDVSHRLVHAQQESRKNMVKERLDEIRKLMQSGTAKPKDYHAVLAKLKRDYKSMTGKTLIFMSEWFELVEKDVQDQDLDKIRKFMKFADGELPSVAEVSVTEPSLDDAEQDDEDYEKDMDDFDKKIDSLSGKEKQRLGKIRNVLKEDLKDQFAEILREVKDDLDLEEADLDREVAMDKLAETLDDLMGKLSGAEEKIDKVHKHVEKVKKLVDTVNEEDKKDSVLVEGVLSHNPYPPKEGLKHDGKNSIKKSLDDEIFEDESDVESDEKDLEDSEDKKVISEENSGEDENIRFEKAHEQLMEVEKKLADLNKDLEYETNQLKKLTSSKLAKEANIPPELEEIRQELNSLNNPNKVEVKIVNANPKETGGPLSQITSQDDKIVKKLESSIKDKLEKFGMETGGKIEVKLITTSFPSEGEEDQQYQNMVYNLLTGNQAGYDDIDSQRKAEKNYKFSWDDSMLSKMTEKFGDNDEEIYVSPQDVEGAKSVIAGLEDGTDGDELVGEDKEEKADNVGADQHDEF